MKRKKMVSGILAYGILILLAIVFLMPFYIVLTGSFKSYQEIFLNVFGWPHNFTWDNYRNSWKVMDLVQACKNSFVITVCSIVGLVLMSSMAAWWIQRRQNGWHRILYFLFVASMIIPFPAVMIPLLKVQSTMHLNNTIPGIVICYYGFGVAFAVFLYHGFLKSVPASMEEAAVMDGCTPPGVFWRIVFPMLKPTTATLVVLDAFWIWNDYLLPSIILQRADMRTIPITISFLFDQFNSRRDIAMAAITMSMIPVLLLFAAFQKHIVAGIASGAVKG